jgi:uncharacterized protein YkwD
MAVGTTRHRSVRTTALLIGCLVMALSALTACTPHEQGVAALNLMNQARGKSGVGQLRWDQNAADKAQAWAEHLAATRTLQHSVLTDGIAGSWTVLGENVGFADGIGAAHAAFMNSPKHRENILNGAFNAAGVGVAQNGNLVFVVQVFRG